MAYSESDKKYTLTGAAAVFGIVPLVLGVVSLLSIPIDVWISYVFTRIWNWFVIPYFHLNPISLWVSFGVLYAVYLVTFSSKVVKDEEINTWASLSVKIVNPAIVLLLGYIVHHFVK